MKQKFTVQIRGNVLIDNQTELETQMREVLAKFPNFVPTFSSVEVWADYTGNIRLFNDDGSEYRAPAVTEKTVQADELEVSKE